MPGEPHNNDIQYSKNQKPGRMCKAESVELVKDEQPEHHQCRRVIPEFLSQQPYDHEQFDDSMAQQVEGRKMLRAYREILRRMYKVVRNEIPGLFGKFILGYESH